MRWDLRWDRDFEMLRFIKEQVAIRLLGSLVVRFRCIKWLNTGYQELIKKLKTLIQFF